MITLKKIKEFFMGEDKVRLDPCPVDCKTETGCDKCLVPAVLKFNVKDESKTSDKFGAL